MTLQDVRKQRKKYTPLPESSLESGPLDSGRWTVHDTVEA